MGALTAAVVAVSLLLIMAAEGSHPHDSADPPAACAVCELVHKVGPVMVSGAKGVEGPRPVHIPAPAANRLNAGTVSLSPHRSRAPPLPISP